MEGNRKEKRKPLNQTSYMVHTIPYICKEKLSVNVFKWKTACFHPSAIAISRCIMNQETFKKRWTIVPAIKAKYLMQCDDSELRKSMKELGKTKNATLSRICSNVCVFSLAYHLFLLEVKMAGGHKCQSVGGLELTKYDAIKALRLRSNHSPRLEQVRQLKTADIPSPKNTEQRCKSGKGPTIAGTYITIELKTSLGL